MGRDQNLCPAWCDIKKLNYVYKFSLVSQNYLHHGVEESVFEKSNDEIIGERSNSLSIMVSYENGLCLQIFIGVPKIIHIRQSERVYTKKKH